jgi:hypothetical protein
MPDTGKVGPKTGAEVGADVSPVAPEQTREDDGRRAGDPGRTHMGSSSLLGHFPTFVAGSRGLLRLVRVTRRAGVWLSPRLAMALVLLLSFELAWIMAVPEPTGRFMVPAVLGVRTLVGFSHRTPPPWPRGNCFGMSVKTRWLGPIRGTPKVGGHVLNMHAENFSEVVKRLKLQSVEIQPVAEAACLITDPRIPREWLLEEPCRTCFGGPGSEGPLRHYPDHFRIPLHR